MSKIVSLLLLSLLLACFIALGTTDSQQKQEQQQGNENPYVFDQHHFDIQLVSQAGRFMVLPKFTNRSPLLRGIENYRLGIFEAEPQTFVLPNHWDTDAIYFVAKGRATVSRAKQDERESFSIKEGDVVRMKAGSSGYVVNQDNNQRLVVVKLLIPVNTPGEFQGFFAAGGENSESFFSVFSNEILQAAFNTRGDRIQRVLGQRKQEWIIKASEQQIRSLMSHDEKGSIWPFQKGESSGNTYNLYEERPRHSNQYGQHYEVDENQFKQLREHNVRISLSNITQGAMTDIYYNSKATKILIVLDGFGYSQMACPHLSQQQGVQQGSQEWQQGGQQGQQGSQEWQPGQQQGSQQGGQQGSQQSEPRYQRLSAALKPGTVVVVPAGHPFVTVASYNQNLKLLAFEINAQGNEVFNLAGRGNVISQLEREAKALSFGVPAELVDEVFGGQKGQTFFQGPRQQGQGRAEA